MRRAVQREEKVMSGMPGMVRNDLERNGCNNVIAYFPAKHKK
jgi:hypothetical protein